MKELSGPGAIVLRATLARLVAWALCAVLGAAPLTADDEPPHFDTQVLPILTKAGCNAGACHGAAVGRGGFKLSLWGSDAKADYEAIVLSLEGRRVNLVRPEESLLLTKPTGVLDHGGGERLEYGGPEALLIADWIRAGAPRGKPRQLTGFRVDAEPLNPAKVPAQARYEAWASFDGGPEVNVTSVVILTPADPAAVTVDDATRSVTVQRPGRHVVIARFLDRLRTLTYTVPIGKTSPQVSRMARHNFIDDQVNRALAELRVGPSPMADDASFLRRARLDLTGRLPAPDELRAFAADQSPSKRAHLIDRLLGSEEYVEFWTWRTAGWLRIRTGLNDAEGVRAYHAWLREQVRAGTSWLKVAQTMVMARGDSHLVGPANFHRSAGDARAMAEHFSEVLMGARIRCANCHNHPLDRWTQEDYHGLAAVFARLERGRHVHLGTRGEVIHPATGEPAAPRVPGGAPLASGGDHLLTLADWLAHEQSQFTRATVNRVWKAMFGRGLVEPTDDLRATNPATHEVLLDELVREFAGHDYDLRWLLRTIARSAAYQRSARTTEENASDDRYYSHALYRPLEAEVLADALADVTGTPDPSGRAVAIIDPAQPVPSLDILGRCGRRDGCETAEAAGGGLSARLHLLNGPLINDRLRSARGRLHALLAAGKSNDEIVAEMYVRALTRAPNDKELAYWRAQAAAIREGDASARRLFLEDFCWALLNSREFATNH